ncbi:hypothetical protein V6N12_022220 [Hibiscus sabdariffa]|uniref:Uncharacterized protein n=1 Tax=Hibiscus sabdariffa TaxID=183260 RepID=A0ABR2FU07_9ROSI
MKIGNVGETKSVEPHGKLKGWGMAWAKDRAECLSVVTKLGMLTKCIDFDAWVLFVYYNGVGFGSVHTSQSLPSVVVPLLNT